MIYLDNNSTTQLDPRVLEVMMPFLTSEFGNAASSHTFGRRINNHVKSARENIAALLQCDPGEVVFTSGATEAVNLGLKGVAKNYRSKGNHIITANTEHPAVLDTCKSLEADGYDITYLPVDRDGLIDLMELKAAIKEATILICVMYVNNETGVIQPISDIADTAHEHGALFMCDATQAIGRIPINVYSLGIDLLAFSAHKFYGPKGIGGLFIQHKQPKVKMSPILHGGGHEHGLRSGTLNVPGIVGMAMAAQLAMNEMQRDADHVTMLRTYLEESLLKEENAFLNGSYDHRLYNTANLGFKGIDANVVIGRLQGIALSNGSACTSAIMEPSHVLKAMGLSNEDAYSSIRFSLGRFNSLMDIETTISTIKPLLVNAF
ncbi:cysteine desulfurase [Dyadobacter sandarakinus]|uniref:cysteine desulfurase n=2 Tax=Dyadobacter sandarakinus TaxID=2747268 RepID=A0ABX7IDZ0_9BACT|nr:cysteine desulfurase [Dyadobacter sandarakinus]